MYHVIQHTKDASYILVETPSYMSSDSSRTIPKSLHEDYHFDKLGNVGLPIEEALARHDSMWKLLFSVEKTEDIETNYPEYFI